MTLKTTDIAALSRLLDEAMAMDATERERWLADLPATDAHLAQPLREMLCQEMAGTASERLSTLPRLSSDEAVASAGDRVGPYRLLREIGRGGMGSVWLAERADGQFERQAALKLPRLAWGAGLGERMVRECRIDALLEHPAIARLYDAGVDDKGRHFIAMEYIDGQPIDRWCRDHALDTRARLRLFVQVVKAVAYAHGRLVIHLDLKPANVLVDAEGRTHLLDFGVAKRLTDAAGPDLTQGYGRQLTPQYAAPEQIAGQPVGVAADVYSLGVMLFELLTGRLPFVPRRKTLGAPDEAVLAGDAPLASAVAADAATRKALRGEIDAILAKALKTDPAQRYATADAFADDIGRYLAGETVAARPDSRWYRLRKAIGRNRLGFAAGAAVLVAVTTGSVTTVIQAQRAAREAERARAVTQFVSDIFRASTNPAPADRLKAPPVHGRFLDRNARLIETRFAGQPDVQAELYGAVGRIYVDIGAGDLGLQYAMRQVQALEQRPGDSEALARALMLLAEAHREEGHSADAEASARRAVDLLDVETPLGLDALGLLAQMLLNNGKLNEARSIVGKAEKTVGFGLDVHAVGSARIVVVKAELLQVENRFNEAWPAFAGAIAAAIRAEGPSSQLANRLRIVMATYLAGRGRGQEGATYLEDARQSLSAAGNPGRVQAALVTARYWKLLYYVGGTTYREAREQINSARATVAAWSSSLPQRVLAEIDWSLGVLELRYGNVMAANELMPAAVSILLSSTDSPLKRWEYAAASGLLAMKLGRHDEAEVLIREGLDMRRRARRDEAPFTASSWFFAARNRLMRGDAEGAENLLRQAPAFAPLRGARVPPDYAGMVSFGLAQIRFERGDVAGASATLPPTYGTSPEWDQGNDQAPFALRGQIQCSNGNLRDGLRALMSSIDHVARIVSENDPGLAQTRAAAGLCALKAGDHKLARDLAESSRRAFLAQADVSPWYKAPLAELDRALGRL